MYKFICIRITFHSFGYFFPKAMPCKNIMNVVRCVSENSAPENRIVHDHFTFLKETI